MSISSLSARPLVGGRSLAMARLGVAWQHPRTRQIAPVGLLWHDDERYFFRYARNVQNVPDFTPFLGFPHLDKIYSSSRLFPLFAQRVMDPRRPDFGRYVETLDLALSATPWEQLARSEGRRAGDAIMVVPEPLVDDTGRTISNFLVHGVRHAMAKDPSVAERLGRLREGDELTLVPEPSNKVNAQAIHTADGQGVPLGWVPDLLLAYAHTVRHTGPYSVRVRHINGPEAPIHLRLLVRLDGSVPIGFEPFGVDVWGPVQ